MQTVLAFIVIFGGLVFFHELGHFIFAKRAGIMVREFAIGMGPKIFGVTKGETIYTIRLLPIGGYVQMAGEEMDSVELKPGYRIGVVLNDDNVIEKIYFNQNKTYPNIYFMEVERADLNRELWIEGYNEDEELVRFNVSRTAALVENGKETIIAPYDRQFNSKSVGARTMAIFAGPLFNFILAFFIFMALGFMQGVPTNEPIITEVVEDSPAAVAGMQDGDLVTAINNEPIAEWNDLVAIVQESPNQEIAVDVERNGEALSLTMVPGVIEQEGKEYGQIGVRYASPMDRITNPFEAAWYGVTSTVEYTKMILGLLGDLITGQFSLDMLNGPVGIYKSTEEVAKTGVYNLMHWAAILSINLGIMNLLPLPALDGGRLMFFAVEAVRGKPVDPQKEGMVHFVGIVLLMMLMVAVTWNDIQRFFF
ncbi:RIP metalloprotease RseP [Caryophanon tenue]|uniref:Zinc metalloprotease n=1 Tax=Caryophanon tenue TaxID=33978 RepID=A0A1C0YKU7_9BACL|nr:RIP metalloprotease RseP [Caryophanon tenue]OCS87709.1 RIP metalloprotease RseP [Caryophanon tenue]